jgi:lipopolysaccharide transport system permease protein
VNWLRRRVDDARTGTRLVFRYRHLIFALARREVSDRYAGQMFGILWAVGHPLLLMGVYLFVFGFVFQTRIGGTADMPLNYTVYLLAGTVPWLTIAEMLNKAPVAVTANAALVKQVVFPVEVLPIKSVLSAVPTQIVSSAVLLIYILAVYHRAPITFALLPVVLLLQLIWLTGLSLMLSAVGAYIRDLKDIVQLATLISIYLLPVFYLPSMVPPLFRPLLYLNPFTYLVWCYQDACYFGRIQHPWAWVITAVASAATFAAGWSVFRRLKPMFGNVL